MMDKLDLVGWMSPNEQRWLSDTAFMMHDDAVIVELGSWKGLSTAAIARGCLNTKKHIYAIDTWDGSLAELDKAHKEVKEGKDIEAVFLNNMKLLEYTDYITPIKGKTEDIVKTFDKKIDMLFIDADHRYEAIKKDIEDWLPLMNDGGIVCGHDYCVYHRGVIRAVEEKFFYFENPVDWIWMATSESNYERIFR